MQPQRRSAARRARRPRCRAGRRGRPGCRAASLSRRSISKQRGAEMSSRLMPPKLGASRTTVSTISSTSCGVQADRHRVDAAELLEQHRLALHDRHRGARADVAEPEHRGAVGDHRDRVGRPRCSRRPGPGRRRSPRRPGPRPGCRPSRGRRGRRAATVEAISILPPRCSSKTGSPARRTRRRRAAGSRRCADIGSRCSGVPVRTHARGRPPLSGRTRAAHRTARAHDGRPRDRPHRPGVHRPRRGCRARPTSRRSPPGRPA